MRIQDRTVRWFRHYVGQSRLVFHLVRSKKEKERNRRNTFTSSRRPRTRALEFPGRVACHTVFRTLSSPRERSPRCLAILERCGPGEIESEPELAVTSTLESRRCQFQSLFPSLCRRVNVHAIRKSTFTLKPLKQFSIGTVPPL